MRIRIGGNWTSYTGKHFSDINDVQIVLFTWFLNLLSDAQYVAHVQYYLYSSIKTLNEVFYSTL